MDKIVERDSHFINQNELSVSRLKAKDYELEKFYYFRIN